MNTLIDSVMSSERLGGRPDEVERGRRDTFVLIGVFTVWGDRLLGTDLDIDASGGPHPLLAIPEHTLRCSWRCACYDDLPKGPQRRVAGNVHAAEAQNTGDGNH